jgi:hypothetical protein
MAKIASSIPELRVVAGTDLGVSEAGDAGTDQNPADQGGGGGGGGGDNNGHPPSAWERKRTNKRINEQLKLFGALMNALTALVIGASIVTPLVQFPEKFIENYNPLWFLGGIVLHLFGQVVFGLNYQSEE